MIELTLYHNAGRRVLSNKEQIAGIYEYEQRTRIDLVGGGSISVTESYSTVKKLVEDADHKDLV